MIVGYSLAHNQSFAPAFAETFHYLPIIKERGFIEDVSQVIIGQKCLQAEFQRKGYIEIMDEILYNQASKQFRYYVASIALANANSLRFVTKRGYTQVYASDTRAYFIKELKPDPLYNVTEKTVPYKDKVIHFRFATVSDISVLEKLNHDWLKDNLTDLSNGYLSVAFSPENWEFIISRNGAVVAELL